MCLAVVVVCCHTHTVTANIWREKLWKRVDSSSDRGRQPEGNDTCMQCCLPQQNWKLTTYSLQAMVPAVLFTTAEPRVNNPQFTGNGICSVVYHSRTDS